MGCQLAVALATWTSVKDPSLLQVHSLGLTAELANTLLVNPFLVFNSILFFFFYPAGVSVGSQSCAPVSTGSFDPLPLGGLPDFEILYLFLGRNIPS